MPTPSTPSAQITEFGRAPDGSVVQAVSLANDELSLRLITWGASIQDVRLDGVDHPLVLGSESFEPYLGSMRYFGAIVGRVANRIAGASTTLEGQTLTLDANEGGVTTLHGGAQGAGCVNWALAGHDAHSARFTLLMADGHMGFPGNLEVVAEYRLQGSTIEVEITATTDATTLCGFAQHSYWNLDGQPDLSAHKLQINAENYLPVDHAMIPLGAPVPVAGTGFDFRDLHPVMGRAQIDHNFCLREADTPVHEACRLWVDGLEMTVETNDPGLQIYDAAGHDTAPDLGLSGAAYGAFSGLAIEPQRWPDAPNQPDYPSVVLREGETYRQFSRFSFNRSPQIR